MFWDFWFSWYNYIALSAEVAQDKTPIDSARVDPPTALVPVSSPGIYTHLTQPGGHSRQWYHAEIDHVLVANKHRDQIVVTSIVW